MAWLIITNFLMVYASFLQINDLHNTSNHFSKKFSLTHTTGTIKKINIYLPDINNIFFLADKAFGKLWKM